MAFLKHSILLIFLSALYSSVLAQSDKEVLITFFQDGDKPEKTKKGLITAVSKANISKGVVLNEVDKDGNIVKYSPKTIKQVLFTRDSIIYKPVLFKYRSTNGVDYEVIRLARQIYDGRTKLFRIDLSKDDELKIYGFSSSSNSFIGTNRIVYVVKKDGEYYYLRKIESIHGYEFGSRQYFEIKTKEEYKNYLNYIFQDVMLARERILDLNFSDYALAQFIAWAEKQVYNVDGFDPQQKITLPEKEVRHLVYVSNKFYHDMSRNTAGYFAVEGGLGLEFFLKNGKNQHVSFVGSVGAGTFSLAKKDEAFYNSLIYKNHAYPTYVLVAGGFSYYLTRSLIQPYVSAEMCFVASKFTDVTGLKLKCSVGANYKRTNLSFGAHFKYTYTSLYDSSNGKPVLSQPSEGQFILYDIKLAYFFAQ